MDELERAAYRFMNLPRNDEEKIEEILQSDIIQAIEDSFNGHDVRRDLILKDVNWLIEQALKVVRIEEETDKIILEKTDRINELQKEIDSLTLDKGYLLEENKELKEKVRQYEMMYHNTGAMFNRMTMKEKIERYEKVLKDIDEILDKSAYSQTLEKIGELVCEALISK